MSRNFTLALVGMGLALSLASCVTAVNGKSPDPAVKKEALRCIPSRQIKQTYIINDYIVVYQLKGGALYRNTFAIPCSGLSFYNAFTTEYRNPYRLCQGDNLLVSLTQSSCRLREFTRISSNDLHILQYAAYIERQKKKKESKKED
jgi:hypothetical protein